MARGVYRRPPQLRRRRFVPHHVAAATGASRPAEWVRRPRRAQRRGRVVRRRRIILPRGPTQAVSLPPVLRRRLQPTARRALARRRAFIQATMAFAATSAPVLLRHRLRPVARRAAARRRVVLPNTPRSQLAHAFPRRIPRQAQRRHSRLSRRVILPPLLSFAPTRPVLLLRRLQPVARRASARRRRFAPAGSQAAQTLGKTFVRRQVGRRPEPVRRPTRRPLPKPKAQPPQPVIPSVPIIRMLKAVGRMKRAMQRRLRWKPLPETIPPIITPTITVQVTKGRISGPGMEEARISGPEVVGRVSGAGMTMARISKANQ